MTTRLPDGVERHPPSQAVVVTVLVLASAASIASTDMYAPSLPHLPGELGASAEAVKLTVTLNVLAFALAQLVHGPLSDRFGRRPVLLAGLAGFTLFSAACAFSQSVEQLIVARVFQGMSASVEAVVGLAVVWDLYKEDERVRVLAIWGVAVALSPAIAPVIGGYVHVSLGWRANFFIIAAAGLLAATLVWRLLPESATPDREAVRPRELARGYAALLLNRRFMGYALLIGAGLGAIYAFVTAGPFLLIDNYGVATEHFGFYQAVIVAAYAAGSLYAKRRAGRMRAGALLRVGIAVSALGALALPVLVALGLEGALALTAAMSAITFGLGPVFAVAPSLALDACNGRAGAASALIGTVEMGTAGVASAVVAGLHDGTIGPLALVLVLLMAVGVAAHRVANIDRLAR